MRMGCILTRLMEFALQILLGDFHLPQGHADILVPEQLHESGEANPEPKHFGRETVPQPVRYYMGDATGALGGLI
jgi:hypothetical protein